MQRVNYLQEQIVVEIGEHRFLSYPCRIEEGTFVPDLFYRENDPSYELHYHLSAELYSGEMLPQSEYRAFLNEQERIRQGPVWTKHGHHSGMMIIAAMPLEEIKRLLPRKQTTLVTTSSMLPVTTTFAEPRKKKTTSTVAVNAPPKKKPVVAAAAPKLPSKQNFGAITLKVLSIPVTDIAAKFEIQQLLAQLKTTFGNKDTAGFYQVANHIDDICRNLGVATVFF